MRLVTGIFRFLFHFIFRRDKAFLIRLISITGFFPGRISLYELAFVHKSMAITDDHGIPVNNERLEFLGDAVLGMAVGEYLYKTYPDKKEGFLTQMRSKIVSGSSLGQLADQMNLDLLIQTNISGSQTVKHLTGDAVEALIGAIYLDKGFRIAKRFILKRVIDKHLDIDVLEKTETNYKSQLVEWGQKFHKEVVFYTDFEPYDPTLFISYVSIAEKLYGSGTGVSKKEAEQIAARETLAELNKS